jgi:GNAT superfamily N-acetyltransferase
VLEERPDHLLIYSIAVNPTEQRQGYGRALLNFADQRAVAIGVSEIRLYPRSRLSPHFEMCPVYRGGSRYLLVNTRASWLTAS